MKLTDGGIETVLIFDRGIERSRVPDTRSATITDEIKP